MAITTYAELLTALENWAKRSDLDDRYPEFIALAEADANRQLDCRQMYTRNASFTVDSVTESLPTGFAGVRSFFLNTAPVTRLQCVRPDEFEDTREAAREGTGRPKYYTIIGDTFVFSPSPDSAYTATLVYRTRVTALSAVNTTNWLLTAHPDVYLNGAMTYAAQYMEDEALEAKHRVLFEGAIKAVNADDGRQSFGAAPARRVRGFV